MGSQVLGRGGATTGQVNRSPLGALSTLSSAPRGLCRKSCTVDLPEDAQVVTEASQLTQESWAGSKGSRQMVEGQPALCGAEAEAAKDNSICWSPSPLPGTHPMSTTAKVLNLEIAGIGGLLCYRGPFPGLNPCNTIPALGEAAQGKIAG